MSTPPLLYHPHYNTPTTTNPFTSVITPLPLHQTTPPPSLPSPPLSKPDISDVLVVWGKKEASGGEKIKAVARRKEGRWEERKYLMKVVVAEKKREGGRANRNFVLTECCYFPSCLIFIPTPPPPPPPFAITMKTNLWLVKG